MTALRLVATTLLDDPDTLFVFAVSIVAVLVSIGKLIERVFRLRDTQADKWM